LSETVKLFISKQWVGWIMHFWIGLGLGFIDIKLTIGWALSWEAKDIYWNRSLIKELDLWIDGVIDFIFYMLGPLCILLGASL